MTTPWRNRVLALWLLSCAVAAPPAAAQDALQPGEAGAGPVRFVVLGHIRGDMTGGLNPRLAELLDEVRALAPSFVVLTGDIIWGDYQSAPPDPARVTREWNEVDEALATLNLPVYRVPGNHDISDVGTRDIWIERYGAMPQVAMASGVRLLLLTSTRIPPDGGEPTVGARGVPLDEAQRTWLETELARDVPAPTFAFMHHLLWWEPANSPWWTDVHPALADAGVRAVFTGDYGPLKFSTTERDGVEYYQSSIETPVGLRMLQINPAARVLSSQFDNYLEVIVDGPSTDVVVHTVAEVSSGEFTPARFYAITQGPPPPIGDRLRDFLGSRNRIAAVLLVASCGFFAGWFVAWRGRRRRR